MVSEYPVQRIETKRLVLEPLACKHAASYEKHFNNYEITRYLSDAVPWPYPKGGALDFIKNVVEPNQGFDEWHWAILEKSQLDETIGCISLRRNSPQKNRGFWLAKQFWRQGYMTETCRAINDEAFLKLGFEKLYFTNAVGNEGSKQVKLKTGAKFEKVIPGTFVDPTIKWQELWSLSKAEWLNFR